MGRIPRSQQRTLKNLLAIKPPDEDTIRVATSPLRVASPTIAYLLVNVSKCYLRVKCQGKLTGYWCLETTSGPCCCLQAEAAVTNRPATADISANHQQRFSIVIRKLFNKSLGWLKTKLLAHRSQERARIVLNLRRSCFVTNKVGLGSWRCRMVTPKISKITISRWSLEVQNKTHKVYLPVGLRLQNITQR